MIPLFLLGALAGILGTGGGWWWYESRAIPMGTHVFLSKICPLQLRIYDISQRHLTLYQFLGTKPNATEDELVKTYQAHGQKLEIEIGTCLDKVAEDDDQRLRDQMPKACIGDAFAKVEKKTNLVADTTVFLLDETAKSQYNMYFMPRAYQMQMVEDSIDDKSDLGKWMKGAEKAGKLQGSVDDVFNKVCKGFMDK
ncbi:hypothetical protein CDV31_016863 [Fusarium ambrosium]|uniref:Uncharacterized protein n=1 Tax=Fusarium ambrosium TaxID=131363 RepID=A0A428S038_9HYPO|nr:hypothetical protein CDV31_016863 [Fusarium ambrosium]